MLAKVHNKLNYYKSIVFVMENELKSKFGFKQGI